MPSPRKKTSSFAQRVKKAAQMTAQEQAERKNQDGQAVSSNSSNDGVGKSRKSSNNVEKRRKSVKDMPQKLRRHSTNNLKKEQKPSQSNEESQRRPSQRRATAAEKNELLRKEKAAASKINKDSVRLRKNSQTRAQVRTKRNTVSIKSADTAQQEPLSREELPGKQEPLNWEDLPGKQEPLYKQEQPRKKEALNKKETLSKKEPPSRKEQPNSSRQTRRTSESGEEKSPQPKKFLGKASAIPSLPSVSRRMFAFAISIILVLILCASVYPVGKTYYTAMRTQQRQSAILEAEQARNEEISKSNNELKEKEGIENEARKSGYVKKGEKSVSVTNADDGDNTSAGLPAQIDESKIHAPQTWYYKILDTIFFVDA